MERLLLVCVGGALGAGARYLVVTWAERALGGRFPWGVLGVNVVGSFLIALVMVVAVARAELSPAVRLALTAGFLGGFTTYSSFNQDLLAMIDRKELGTAAGYLFVTVGACLLAGLLGTFVARKL